MKEITVYADFDFLAAPQIIGTLGYEHVRDMLKAATESFRFVAACLALK
ncbi:MAG: hypothetical protein MJY70_07040 [Bacteroidales bacterium]|nr:hypothetical protein [Bacteroidales bacterium]